MSSTLLPRHTLVYVGATHRGGHPLWVRVAFQLILLGTSLVAGYISDLNRRLRMLMLAQHQTKLELQTKYADIEALASTDFLTSLANRRHFHHVAAPLFDTARIKRRTLSVILLDLDHFKTINDDHGHSAGDNVLVRVASQLALSCPNTGVLARFGGEEFIVLLPDTPLTCAEALAETLREDIESLNISLSDNALLVTASVGVASISPDDHSIDRVISRADKALYRAKALGRNRICSASNSSAS